VSLSVIVLNGSLCAAVQDNIVVEDPHRARDPDDISVASVGASLNSNDRSSNDSQSIDAVSEAVADLDSQPNAQKFNAVDQTRAWCTKKLTFNPDATMESVVKTLMTCQSRWRLTDECLGLMLSSICTLLQDSDPPPSAYNLRRMVEQRSSVELRELPVCAKECSVHPTPFKQMSQTEIHSAVCPACGQLYIDTSGKKPKPSKVSSAQSHPAAFVSV